MFRPGTCKRRLKQRSVRNPIIADADTGHGGLTATMKFPGSSWKGSHDPTSRDWALFLF